MVKFLGPITVRRLNTDKPYISSQVNFDGHGRQSKEHHIFAILSKGEAKTICEPFWLPTLVQSAKLYQEPVLRRLKNNVDEPKDHYLGTLHPFLSRTLLNIQGPRQNRPD